MNQPVDATAPAYPAAAPVIRGLLCRAARSREDTTSQQQRHLRTREMAAYAQALRVMAASADQPPAPGIHDEDELPFNSVALARAWLGHDADLVLGTTVPGPPETGPQPPPILYLQRLN